jgi:hypothetical protein
MTTVVENPRKLPPAAVITIDAGATRPHYRVAYASEEELDELSGWLLSHEKLFELVVLALQLQKEPETVR